METMRCKLAALKDELARLLDTTTLPPTTPTHHCVAGHASSPPQPQVQCLLSASHDVYVDYFSCFNFFMFLVTCARLSWPH